MSLPVTFRRVTRCEFDEASAQYEERRAGLGVEFTVETDRCVTNAAEHPKMYALVRGDVRRVTSLRFPFSIYFRAELHRIVVLAVFHGRRNPLIWQSRA